MARVLVVDDDAETRGAFEDLLCIEGYAVDVAATGADGLRLGRMENVDVVLADLRLPDVDGLTLLRHLLSDGIERPFILMTAFASTTTAFEAGRLGVAAYLEKPISSEELLHVLRVHAPGSPAQTDVVIDTSAHTRRALQLIEDRYGNPDFDIHGVATECGVTREHLARVIRETTGRTFTDLLRARRMREARRLLAETSLRIKEIYHQVGLTRASDFDHAFKKTWGVSPKTYRLICLPGRTRAISPHDEESS